MKGKGWRMWRKFVKIRREERAIEEEQEKRKE